jgi:hypothetical protein
MRQSALKALASLLLALGLWSAFAFMVWQLSAERERYATLQSDMAARAQEEELGSRLRTLVRETNEERAVLAELAKTDILTAVATIEATGQAAGANLSIQNVTEPQGTAGDVRTITLVAEASGSLSALVDTLVLLESLPFPAVVENVRLSTGDGADEPWRLTTRIRVITTSPLGT